MNPRPSRLPLPRSSGESITPPRHSPIPPSSPRDDESLLHKSHVTTQHDTMGVTPTMTTTTTTANPPRDDRTWRWSFSALSPREYMQRILLILLVFVCLFGDFFLYQQVILPNWSFFRHLVDSGTHFAVGFCAWGIFLCFTHDDRIPSASLNDNTPLPVLDESAGRESTTMPSIKEWKEFLTSCLLAGFTAAILDIDHFIAAGALSIAGATHLQGRPFGHSVTFVIAVVFGTWLFSKLRGASKWRRIHRISFVVITLMSHQIRDGMRLGLWFWPIGSTPGIFYLVYIFMEIALPIVLAKWQVMDGGRDEDDESDSQRGSSEDTAPEPRSNRPEDDHVGVTQRQEHVTPAQPQLF